VDADPVSDGSLIAQAIGRDWHFKLTVGQWMKLQVAFGKIGPPKIDARIRGEDWVIEDIREVIERGLEGGGMDAAAARTAATEIMDGQPDKTSYALAVDIIGSAWDGMEDLFKKKAAAEAAVAILSKIPTGNGASTTSSESASSPESSHLKPSSSASPSSSA